MNRRFAVAILLLAALVLCAAHDGRAAAPTSRPANTRQNPASRPAGSTRPAAVRGPAALDVEKNKPFLHEPSGFSFPPTLGASRRAAVFRVDDAGEDVTVSYLDPDLKIVATVSVYPNLGVPMPRHFESVKREMMRMHPKAVTTTDGEWKLQQRDAPEVAGLQVIYTYIGPLSGVDQDLVTEMYLISSGRFFIKYRMTYPWVDAKAARGRCQRFLEVLELPKPAKP